MIELDFTVPPQILVGQGAFGDGWPVTVTVSASDPSYVDADDYVSIHLTSGERARRAGGANVAAGASTLRVRRNETAILEWITEHGKLVGKQLDREHARATRLLHGS